jgi:hypothetical protein
MLRDCTHPAQGEIGLRDGSAVWRVWTPQSEAVSLVTSTSHGCEKHATAPDGADCFVPLGPEAAEALRSLFQLADGKEDPDPASRWEPLSMTTTTLGSETRLPGPEHSRYEGSRAAVHFEERLFPCEPLVFGGGGQP